jgi:protein CpxP
MNKKKMMTAVAVLTLGASLAFAAPHEGGEGRHGHGMHHGVFGKKMAEKLNLSDAQKQQIKDIKKSTHAQNAAFFQSARQTRKDFHAAKKANDTAKLDALKPVMESQKAQFKQIRDAEMQKVASVLTPAQNAQWQQLKAQHEQQEQQEKKQQQK